MKVNLWEVKWILMSCFTTSIVMNENKPIMPTCLVSKTAVVWGSFKMHWQVWNYWSWPLCPLKVSTRL